MAKVVIDTNVLVSAFLNKGTSRKLLVKMLETQEVFLSAPMLAELTDVLSRAKFGVKAEAVNLFISILIHRTTVIPVTSNLKLVLADPDDDMILNTAISGKADYIVSGDKHLLEIGHYKEIQIISVNEFAKVLG
jgi:putative PIN family toxin of toxin-antitoxin system